MSLQLPPELRAAAAEGKLVLFIGAGMSSLTQPRLPGWQKLLETMLEQGNGEQPIPAADRQSLVELISSEPLVAAEALRSTLGEQRFYGGLRAILRDSAPEPSAAHRLLPQINLASILTTNFDKLVENSYPSGAPCYTQFDHAELAQVNYEQSFCIVKVHGDIDRGESIILGPSDYRRMMYANEAFRIFLTPVFTTRRVLFLGCSLTDPDMLLFLDRLKFQMEGNLRGHFALMRTDTMNRWKRQNFESSYGIEIIGDDERADFADIEGVLRSLQEIAPVGPREIVRSIRPRQIPPLTAHFVHRTEDERQVKSLLLRDRELPEGSLAIVAIHGMPGTGKSTLATAVALDEAVLARFADGVLWAELKQEPDLVAVLNGWLQELGGAFESGSVEALSQRLRTLLAQKSVLLVLDNVWDAAQARMCLAGGERSRALITTRRADVADELGADLYELGSLSAGEALALLANRLGQDYDAGQREAALSFAETVGRLPLALELAAARVKRGRAWAELESDLRQELARLEVLEDPRRARGQMRLQAAFNLSLDTLRRENQRAWRAFCWLGAIGENAAIAAPGAATVWELPEREAEDVLEILWNDALLSRGPQTQIGGIPRLTYRIHNLLHSTARSFLCAEAPGGLGYKLPEAHAAIADRIFARAGPAAGQPVALALPDDGYSHDNLVWHLERAGRIDAIHELLREESPSGRNAWQEARERLRQMPGFLADVTRAWQLAEARASREAAEPAPVTGVALALRYALMLASVTNRLRNVPPALGVRLVEAKTWTPQEALAFAEVAGWETVFGLIVPLAAYLSEQDFRRLSRVRWGSDEAWSQVALLAVIAASLPKELLAERFDELMAHGAELSGGAPAAQFFSAAPEMVRLFWQVLPDWVAASLAAHLGEEKKREALAALRAKVRTNPRLLWRVWLTTALAGQIDEPERTGLLDEALRLLSESWQTIASEAVEMTVSLYRSPLGLQLIRAQLEMETAVWGADFLSDAARRQSVEQLRDEVIAKLAAEMPANTICGPLLMELVPHLSQSLLMRALDLTRSLAAGEQQMEMAAGVLGRLDEPARSEQVEAAFQAAQTMVAAEPSTDAGLRFRAIAALASVLSHDHWNAVLADLRTAEAVRATEMRDLLVRMLPHVPGDLLSAFAALDRADPEAFAVQYSYGGSGGWSGVVSPDVAALKIRIAMLPRAAEEERRELMPAILRTLDSGTVEVGATLDAASPWMVESEYSALLEQVRVWPDAGRRSDALKAVAPRLPASLVSQAFEIGVSILDRDAASQALHVLAAGLAMEGDWRQASIIGRQIPDAYLRAHTLAAAARAAPQPERKEIQDAAIAAGREIPPGVYRYRGSNRAVECRNVGLALAGMQAEEPERSEIFREAIAQERSGEDGLRWAALIVLSQILAEAGDIAWSFETALSIDDHDARGSALLTIAGYLDEGQRERALAEVAGHYDPATRSKMLAWLAPHLSPPLAVRALAIAAELEDPADRVHLRAALAPHLPEERQQAEIEELLDYAGLSCAPDCQVRAIAGVLGHIATERRPQLVSSALQLCREMEENNARVSAFSELLSALGSEDLDRAGPIASGTHDREFRDRMTAELVVRLAAVGRTGAALDLLGELADLNLRADALRRMGAFLTAEPDLGRALQNAAVDPPGYLTRTDTTISAHGKQFTRIAWNPQAGIVATFSPRVPPALEGALHDRWKQTLHSLSAGERATLLYSVQDLDVIGRALAGRSVSAEIGATILDTVRWWR